MKKNMSGQASVPIPPSRSHIDFAQLFVQDSCDQTQASRVVFFPTFDPTTNLADTNFSDNIQYGGGTSLPDNFTLFLEGPFEYAFGDCSAEKFPRNSDGIASISVTPETAGIAICVPGTDDPVGFVGLEPVSSGEVSEPCL